MLFQLLCLHDVYSTSYIINLVVISKQSTVYNSLGLFARGTHTVIPIERHGGYAHALYEMRIELESGGTWLLKAQRNTIET